MVALVTGGGRGIGRAIALRLAKERWAVAVTARSADQLAETVKLAEGRMIALPADVADPIAVKALAQSVEQQLGPVSLLVNNAGTAGPFGPFWECNPDDWWRCEEVNLRGPMLFCRELLPGMVARREGRIINVVSGAGCQAIADMSAYSHQQDRAHPFQRAIGDRAAATRGQRISHGARIGENRDVGTSAPPAAVDSKASR
ncbi:MAG: SDR family NAD(P)-dependent oxidoreductase [Bryobacteraceae bacterium]